jgi:amidase
MADDVAFWSATELAAAIRSKEISSRELLERYVERIARLDGEINSVVTLDLERANAAAAAADDALASGIEPRPLHGLPITVKDALEVEGIRSTGGATELSDHVGTYDAPVVRKVRDAGAIVFGRTNLPRFSGDLQSYNDIFGTTNNPWDPTKVPGGSSGGAAAAVAAAFTAFEIGTDIGGSIRVPASFNGIFGHKPSYGATPATGYLDEPLGGLTVADVNVIGPLARSAADLDLLMGVMAGPTDEVDLAAAADLGLRLIGAAVSLSADDDAPRRRVEHRAWLEAHRERCAMRAAWVDFFRDWDAVLAPVCVSPPFPHDHDPDWTARAVEIDGARRPYLDLLKWTMAIGVNYLPVSVPPIGRTSAGLPVGVQIVGPYLEDRTCIELAGHVERLLGGYVAPPVAV